ncbi:hypothetical protein D0C36_02445 [Mucilaginibacter conchicola]|uniref:Uncharacterized protein n=1 Tax=Mucilaginibacter conchicola TaxID=2303333 RepID=A0A372NWF2_9SPHI|nr:hypothetical protein [Mucilaginibacter conchicola]RFZ94430.1 hypothetical protein D0C36_02445 [Mucilaginibacter conchicola]
MGKKEVDYQTNLYLYELRNLAKEHGFKPEEQWELSMETVAGKADVQHNFFPTNIAKITPDILLQVLHSVKAQLNLSLTEDEQSTNSKRIALDELSYLVAHNPKRPRK